MQVFTRPSGTALNVFVGTLLKVSTQQFGSSVFADDCSKECYRVVVVSLFSPNCFARFCCVELKCTERLTNSGQKYHQILSEVFL